MSDDWTPDTRPVPVELEDGYQARHYGEPTRFPTIAERLNSATIHQMFEMARGGTGEPVTE